MEGEASRLAGFGHGRIDDSGGDGGKGLPRPGTPLQALIEAQVRYERLGTAGTLG